MISRETHVTATNERTVGNLTEGHELLTEQTCGTMGAIFFVRDAKCKDAIREGQKLQLSQDNCALSPPVCS